MAFGDFKKKKKVAKTEGEPGAGPTTRAVARASSDTGTTYIDEASEFSGKLHMKQNVFIDGVIEGEVQCDRTVTIGSPARVHANITAECVIVEGKVEGDIIATQEITLHKNSTVVGDMRTGGVVVERGAKVEGRIEIKADEKAAPPAIGPPASHDPLPQK